MQDLKSLVHLDILQWNKFSTLGKSIHEVFSAKAREQPGAVAVEVNKGARSGATWK